MRHTPRTALAIALALGILGAPGTILAQSPSPTPSTPAGPTTTLRLPPAPGASFGLCPTEALRVFVLGDGEQVVAITAESEQATEFEAFLEVGQPVLDSMAIAGPDLPPGVARIAG